MLCWDQLAETAQSILYLIVPPRSLSRFVTHFHILISVSSLDRRNIELSPSKNIHQPPLLFRCKGVLALSSSLDNGMADDILDRRAKGRLGGHARNYEVAKGWRKRRQIDNGEVVFAKSMPRGATVGNANVCGNFKNNQAKAILLSALAMISIDLNSPKDVRRHDKHTSQHLWCHIHPITLPFQPLLPCAQHSNIPATHTESRTPKDLDGLHTRPAGSKTKITDLEGTS